jgi:hypothetical protein
MCEISYPLKGIDSRTTSHKPNLKISILASFLIPQRLVAPLMSVHQSPQQQPGFVAFKSLQNLQELLHILSQRLNSGS